MSAQLVKPIKCRKCHGTGIWQCLRGPDTCSRCGGTTVEEGDKATVAALKLYGEQRRALGQAILAWDREDILNRHAHFGLMYLEQDEPERAHKAVASFAAGRQDVLPALDAYWTAWSEAQATATVKGS